MKQMTDQLMNTGLSSMGSVSLKNYRDLAKQLGDYYLPGPQNYFNRLVLEMEAYQKDQDKSHYHQAVEVLKRLRALEKKAAVYLNGKLDTDFRRQTTIFCTRSWEESGSWISWRAWGLKGTCQACAAFLSGDL